MNTKIKLLITLAVLTFFYGLYYWGLPLLINIDKRIDFFEEQIFQKTGYKFDITSPKIKMGFTTGVWLMADNVSFIDSDNTNALNSKKFAVKIHLLPLIFKKIQIANLSCDSIDANLKYSSDGKLSLGNYTFEKKASKMTLSRARFRIKNYKINLDDLKQNKKVVLIGKYFSIDEFKKNKHIKLSTDAKLYVGQKSSDIVTDIDIKLPLNRITENQFKVNGSITNINLADFSDYAKSVSPIESLSGKINFIANTDGKKYKKLYTKLTIDNLGIMQKDIAKSIYCKDKLQLIANAGTMKNGIKIHDLTFISNDINVLLNGDIKHLNDKDPLLDLNLDIKNSKLERIIPLMPPNENSNEDINFYELKKKWFYADLNGKLNIKGRLSVADIFGEILATNGHIVPLNAPKATIKLIYKGSVMDMDVKVPAPNNEVVTVKGTSNLYGNQKCDLLIGSSQNVDLKSTQDVLNALYKILKFEIGPLPVMDVRGIGNINLHVYGTKKEPHAFGQFNFKKSTVGFLGVNNMWIKDGTGKLVFNDIDTHFIISLTNSIKISNFMYSR